MSVPAILGSSIHASLTSGNMRLVNLQRPAVLFSTTTCRSSTHSPGPNSRTCRHCKQQFVPAENNSSACRYHPAHFGGETKRKFESVHTGGTMETADSGKIFQYWHCCGSRDAFDMGCERSPHLSYDD